MAPFAQLTFADHEKGGFVPVHRFTGFASVDAAVDWVNAFEAVAVAEDSDAPYEFILDAFESPGSNVAETWAIPMQMALRLSHSAVHRVLQERPEPDEFRRDFYAQTPAPDLAEFGLDVASDAA